MKSYLALLLGAAICFGAIAPTTAEARDHRGRDGDRHERFDRSKKGHGHHRHHHERRSHRVLRKAHYEYHHGHRVWVPARWVTVYY